ncbi:MAG TPA: hypothetical protein PLK63_13835 [Catalimonadaceae bacterium]|nr:hypothetical protein [Catalimonadaceae bacterium]
MKVQFKNLAYFFIAGMIGFTSCSKDDENVPAPTLTFTSGGASSASFNSNETVSFSMDLASDDDYTSLKATLSYTDNSSAVKSLTVKDANNSNKEINYTKNSDIETAYDGSNIVKVALPSDAKRGTAWTITVVAATSGGSTTATFTGKVVNSWSAKLLGAQLNSAGSYFNSLSGEVLSGTAASATPANVDITYAALGSPVALPTILSYKQRGTEGLSGVPAGAEESYFVKTTLTPSEFTSETGSWAGNFTGVALSTTSPQKVALEADGVYAFKNKSGKMGLIHVATIVDGTSGSVTINVKSEN